MKTLLFLSIFITAPSICHALENVLAGTMHKDYDLAYSYEPLAGYNNPDWLKHLPDQTLIADLSLPGSNNALSIASEEQYQTQMLPITAQLEMGIRFFDVRFKYKEGTLQTYQGSIKQEQRFENFLNDINTFLISYPSEMVLIRVINTEKINEKAFLMQFNQVNDNYKSKQYIPKEKPLTLGDLRGNYLYIQNFYANTKIGLKKESLFIQELNKLDNNWALYKKWERIKKHFEQYQTKQQISLNYLSADQGVFPYFVASGKSNNATYAPQLVTGAVTKNHTKWQDFPRKNCINSLCSIVFMGTNQLTQNWIAAVENKDKKLGVVVADFSGPALIKSIIVNNARLITGHTEIDF